LGHEQEEVVKRATYIVLIVAAAVAVGLFYWRPWATQEPEVAMRSAVVERGTLLVAVSASGSVEPQARVDLAFESPGEVAEVLVDVGDRVKAGDVLARLDTAQLALQAEQARAALALAEAQRQQLQEGARQQEIAAAEANLRAMQAQASAAAANRDQLQAGASDAEIAAAQAQVAAMELQHKAALIVHDRTINVEKEKDQTKREQVFYDLYTAEKALAAAQAQLDDLLSGADADAVRAAQANVSGLEAQGDASQAQLDLLSAGATAEQVLDVDGQIAQAEAALELAELSLEEATLYAPFDGRVAAVDVTAGEMATTLPAVTLLDVSRFHVTVSVDEIDVGRLELGQVARVTLDAFPGAEIPGVVRRIAPAATIEGGVVYYDVVVDLNPTDVPIRADMTANATVAVEELPDVLKIPTWVVRVDQDTGQTYVHKRVGDDFERVDVALGVRYEGVAQVLSGLSEGDEAVWVEDSSPFGFGGQ
jgi:HlyD family secretion protein